MMLAQRLALVMPLLAGYGLSGLLQAGSEPDSVRVGPLLRLCLSLGWALGMSSSLLFVGLVLAGRPGWAFCGVDLALFAGLAVLGAVLGRSRGRVVVRDERPEGVPKWVGAVLHAALVGSLGVGIASFVLFTLHSPNGGWDAVAIWNLRARFLYRGGDSWAEAFDPCLIASHLDYPLLIPASIARCWFDLGRETPAVPALLALAFTLATVGLLGAALGTLRGRVQGVLGVIVVLATPLLFEQGSQQLADVPLGYFFLATVAALVVGGRSPSVSSRWALAAGTMAGCAAWTKNEGLPFLAVVVAARLAAVVPSRGWKAYRAEAAWFALGLAPVLAVVVGFKLRFSPPNDFLADQGLHSLAVKLADPSRYVQVGRAVAEEVVKLGGGAIVWLTAYRLLLGGRPRHRAEMPDGRFAILVPALMLSGYVLIYIVTPLPLDWHLRWSLSRLIIQLWPLAVFDCFLVTATPEEALAAARPERAADSAARFGQEAASGVGGRGHIP